MVVGDTKWGGTCIYIHPDRRYFTLEFKFEKGTIRESYFFPTRQGGEDRPAVPKEIIVPRLPAAAKVASGKKNKKKRRR